MTTDPVTPIQLTDLKIVQLCEHGQEGLHTTSACAQHEGRHKERPDCYCDVARELSESDLLSVLTDEALIGELVKRGVLEEQAATSAYWPFRLFAVRREPVGSVEGEG